MRASLRLTATLVLSLSALATLQHCGGDPEPALPGGVDAGTDAPRPRGREAGDDPPELPEEDLRTKGAGSRFRPVDVEVVYDDGARERYFAEAFVDLQREEVCTVEENGSGGYACLPQRRRRAIEAFTDSSCQSPAVASAKLDDSDEFLWEDDRYAEVGAPCSPRIVSTEGHARGEAFVKNARGLCVRHFYDGWIIPNPKIVPISSFGTFTRSEDTRTLPGERSGTRLVLERWRLEGEDGSFVVRTPRIVDSVRKASGQVLKAADGRSRFFTAFNGVHDNFAGFFADPTCSTSILAFEKDRAHCGDDPLLSNDGLMRREAPATGCITMKQVSPPLSAPLSTVYASYGAGTCEPSEPASSSMKHYPAPAVVEVPDDALAEVSEKIVVNNKESRSGPRLEARVRVQSSADGLELEERGSRLYLRKFDLPCRPGFVWDDEEPRCVPDIPWVDDSAAYFADAACTEALVALRAPELCAPPSPLYRDPGFFPRIFRRQGDSVSTVYVKAFDGTCTLHDKPGSGLRFFRRGTPEQVPAADFPRMMSNEYVLSR